MTVAKSGNTVKVHYTGKLKDGTVFDSSLQRNEPLEFTLGQGNMIAGFEKAVDGMQVGDSTVADIPVAEAYGEVRDDMILEVPKKDVPENITPEVGQRLAVQQKDGQSIPVTISKVSEESITLDANHPLAGKDLVFEIELLEIK
ncbi:peptidylprolyl isomerase [Catalinimonas sp. 4WD22]|jgi:peptidylprolyl isomerase|uniref:FKBP-type peptidyl-prolyl cis-trans isomerase n=1 Tax=Catalinimonas locisalis TaxID=3133978 RepID=UPI003101ACF3